MEGKTTTNWFKWQGIVPESSRIFSNPRSNARIFVSLHGAYGNDFPMTDASVFSFVLWESWPHQPNTSITFMKVVMARFTDVTGWEKNSIQVICFTNYIVAGVISSHGHNWLMGLQHVTTVRLRNGEFHGPSPFFGIFMEIIPGAAPVISCWP